MAITYMKGIFIWLSDWLVHALLRYPFPLLFAEAWTDQELAAAQSQPTPVRR